MPLHQSGRMPHQHGQQVVQKKAAPQGNVKAGLLHQLFSHFGGNGLVAQRQAGQTAVVKQRSQRHDQHDAHSVENAQNGQSLGARVVATKGGNDQAGAWNTVLRGLSCAQHHDQKYRWHENEGNVRANDGQHANQRHGRHAEKQQRSQCHGLAPEGLHAQLDPLQASAGRNDMKFHVCVMCKEKATESSACNLLNCTPHLTSRVWRGAAVA